MTTTPPSLTTPTPPPLSNESPCGRRRTRLSSCIAFHLVPPLRLFGQTTPPTPPSSFVVRGQESQSGQYLQQTPHPTTHFQLQNCHRQPCGFPRHVARAQSEPTVGRCATARALPRKHHGIRRLNLEMPGIEPGASRMQSERSTAELHPHDRRGDRRRATGHLPTSLTPHSTPDTYHMFAIAIPSSPNRANPLQAHR